jgi:predicted RNA-binding protein with PUA-like domain
MAYWLLKTEPSDYSFADLQKEKRVVWSGVTNALALKHMRTMQKGDEVLIYHTGDEKAVVGLAKIAKGPYVPAGETNDKRVVVDVAAGKALPRPVGLAGIKADPRFKAWGLVKIGRLSVVPTSPEEFAAVQQIAAS